MTYPSRPRPHSPQSVRRSRLTQSLQKGAAQVPRTYHPTQTTSSVGFREPGLPRSQPLRSKPAPPPQRKVWLAGGSVAFLAAIAVLPTQIKPLPQAPVTNTHCQTVVQKEARLSREQLSQFLALPEQADKSAVQAVIQAPYCELPVTDTATSREVYPLAFDPDTWFVVEYTNDLYSSYSFQFRQER